MKDNILIETETSSELNCDSSPDEFPLLENLTYFAEKCGFSESVRRNMVFTLQLITFVAFLIFYIFVYEPLTFLLIENHQVRWKVQGNFVRILESLTAIIYERAFEYELIGFEHINPEALSIVTSNHQGLIDYLTIMNLAGKAGLLNSTFFFVWKHCVRLPSLSVLYNQWLKRSNWRVPNVMLPRVFEPVLESPWKEAGGKWVVIFPEVTPWSVSYMLEHRAECAKNGCPKLQNLLYPRFNAFVQTVSFLCDYPVTDVYDLTITYLNPENQISVPTWYDLIVSEKSWKIRVEVKRTRMAGIPHKEKHIVRWLEKQWYEKDEAISKYKASMNPKKGVGAK